MSFQCLADFLEDLSSTGQLARVGAEVDPALEIAEITRRVAKDSGPALLFDRVRSQTMSIVTNLFGSEARVCRALDIESLDEISARIESLIEQNTPQNWFDRLKTSGDAAGADKFRPRSVKTGACQQVVRLGRDVDLAALPLVKQWPAESATAITAGQLSSTSRDGRRGVSACPLQMIDSTRLAVVDDGHSEFARHWSDHLAAGEKMTVAVVLGGHPASMIAASLDLPVAVDTYHLAGLLRGQPVDVVKCRTHALEVPAEADLILEGYLDPQVSPVVVGSGGAGGSHYRTRQAAVLHVTAITHRSHPIVPAIVECGPWGESGSLAKVRERILVPMLRSLSPEIVDVHLPTYGGPDRFAFVSFRKTYPFHARQVASALWGSAALRFTKFVILVDPAIDVHDTERVLSELGANVSPERDVFNYDGPVHRSDHAAAPDTLGRHLGIDATSKIDGEQTGGTPAALNAGAEIEQLVTSRWSEYKLESGKTKSI